LPAPSDLTVGDLIPQAILECRLVKKGNAAIPQVLVHWCTLSPASATWENYNVLKQRFPDVDLAGRIHLKEGRMSRTPRHLASLTRRRTARHQCNSGRNQRARKKETSRGKQGATGRERED